MLPGWALGWKDLKDFETRIIVLGFPFTFTSVCENFNTLFKHITSYHNDIIFFPCTVELYLNFISFLA